MIALPYLGLVAIDARCLSRWSIADMIDVMFGVPPQEKKSIASLKTYDGCMISQKKTYLIKGHTPRMSPLLVCDSRT